MLFFKFFNKSGYNSLVMGLGTFIIGVAVGAGALFFFMNRAEGQLPILPPPEFGPIEDSVDIFVDTTQISSERWNFEATYRNRTNVSLRTKLVFELRDPQNGLVFKQEQDINFDPDSTIQVFWDTLDVSNFSNIEGNFNAEFRVEELFTGNQFARPFNIIIPISFPSPYSIPLVI